MNEPWPEEEYRDRTADFHRIAAIFVRHHGELAEVRTLARQVAELTEQSGEYIQANTAVVCPSCTRVCCATRHSYHEVADIIYLCALGEALPVYAKGKAAGDPCKFIGPKGCTIQRSLRPYRCNWYFCTPLLDHMQKTAARDYRKFMGMLTVTGRKREALLECYTRMEKAGRPNVDGPGKPTGG